MHLFCAAIKKLINAYRDITINISLAALSGYTISNTSNKLDSIYSNIGLSGLSGNTVSLTSLSSDSFSNNILLGGNSGYTQSAFGSVDLASVSVGITFGGSYL